MTIVLGLGAWVLLSLACAGLFVVFRRRLGARSEPELIPPQRRAVPVPAPRANLLPRPRASDALLRRLHLHR